MADRSIQQLLGGGLKPNDPRRFLIEAMLGAMHADGSVDERETRAMQAQIETHPLFAGLGANASKTLIELSMDAIHFAGNALKRAPAIAKGLPARIHRLAAYGMASEIVVADQQIQQSELAFLEALRKSLRVGPTEAQSILDAAAAGQLSAYLDDRYLRVKTLIVVACEVFALRAVSLGKLSDEHRFRVRDLFAAIPDLALSRDELDTELYRAFRRPRAHDAQVYSELARIAQALPDPIDRYWMVVYAMVAELPATVPSWRVIPFIGVLQGAFQIVDSDMELAAIDALAFPAAMPRPD